MCKEEVELFSEYMEKEERFIDDEVNFLSEIIS